MFLFKTLSIVIFVLAIFIIIIKLNDNKVREQDVVKPSSTPTPSSLKVISWIPFWDQQNAYDSFTKNVSSFDFISVFWYRIDKNGNLVTYTDVVEDKSIIDFAHENNVKVLALVANMPDYTEGGDWDYKRVDIVIQDKKARSAHIEDLLSLIDKYNFDGIDIDYEALKRPQRENFSRFIEELADKLHQKGKTLGVAIHPKTSEDNPYEDNGSHAQDLMRIAQVADHMYFMTYLEHGTYTDPGPPASILWMDKIVRYAIDQVGVPRGKVFLGIGLMGVSWRQDPDGSFVNDNNDLSFTEILSITKNKNIEPTWDDISKTPYFEYKDEYGKHIIWFENKHSIEDRIALVEDFGVGGVALWRIGREDPGVWEVL